MFKENFIDAYTAIDDKLSRTNQYLAALVEGEGTVETPDSPDIIFGTITVPDNESYLGIPPGTTTINFDAGRVDNEHVGALTDAMKSMRDISRNLDGMSARLRSFYIYPDAPCLVTVGGASHTLEAGQHYTFRAQGFTEATIETEYPMDFMAAASTRSDGLTVSATSGHSQRRGSANEQVYDDWHPVNMAPQNVIDDYSVVNYPETNEWYIRPFGTKTIQVQNGSTAPNDAEVRILAADDQSPSPVGSNEYDAWYEIGSVTLTQNERHKFVIEEPHHELRVEFTNATAGEEVTVGATCVAVI